MDTKKISLIPTEREYIANAVIGRIPKTVEAQVRLFDPLIKKLLSALSGLWLKIHNRDVWFNTAVSGIFPDLDVFEPSKQNVFFSFAETKFNKSFEGFDGNLMTLPELRASGVEKLSKFSGKLFAFKDGGVIKAYDPADGSIFSFNTANHHEAVCIPSLRFTKKNGLPLAGEELIMVLLDKELVPAGLTPAEEDSFYDLIRLNKSERSYMGLSSEGHIYFDCEKLSEDIAAGKFAGSVNGLDFSMDTLLAVTRIKADEDFSKALKISLLNCEKRRADIDPYDEKLLSDPNRGHWELWSSDGSEPTYAIEISEPLIARDPVSDVDRDGIIAIDFGTKSTVVVYQKSSEHTLPMAIGTGRLADAGRPEHYENPTVMEFATSAHSFQNTTPETADPKHYGKPCPYPTRHIRI